METFVMKLLAPILDRLGSKWKTVVGVGLLFVVTLAYTVGWLDALAPHTGSWFGEHLDSSTELLVWLEGIAGALFGIGVIHRNAKGTK